MTDGYVEFHARSAFSFLEGASLPEALVQQAANLGMPTLGILDRGRPLRSATSLHDGEEAGAALSRLSRGLR